MKEFLSKCEEYKKLCNKLYKDADELAEKIILMDLSKIFNKNIDSGRITVNVGQVEELTVEGDKFNLNNKSKMIYKPYRLHFVRSFNFPYLGFNYKGELISPHMDGESEKLISKYNIEELKEIGTMIDKHMKGVNNDLNYIISITDLSEVEYYYRNYDGMFDGTQKFDDINKVKEDYISLF